MWRDEITLVDIVQACRSIRAFIREMNRDAFLKDLKTRSATLHQLLIVGEATKRLSSEFRDRHPEVPWSEMAGMRDVLIHGYDQVDLQEVWKSATVDIPDVLAKIEPLISESTAPGGSPFPPLVA